MTLLVCLLLALFCETSYGFIDKIIDAVKWGRAGRDVVKATRAVSRSVSDIADAIKSLDGGRHLGEEASKNLKEAAEYLGYALQNAKIGLDTETLKVVEAVDATLKKLPDLISAAFSDGVSQALAEAKDFVEHTMWLVVAGAFGLVMSILLLLQSVGRTWHQTLLLFAVFVASVAVVLPTFLSSVSKNTNDNLLVRLNEARFAALFLQQSLDRELILTRTLVQKPRYHAAQHAIMEKIQSLPVRNPVEHNLTSIFAGKTPTAVVVKIVHYNGNNPLGNNYGDFQFFQTGSSAVVEEKIRNFQYFSMMSVLVTIPWREDFPAALSVFVTYLDIQGTYSGRGNQNWFSIHVEGFWA